MGNNKKRPLYFLGFDEEDIKSFSSALKELGHLDKTKSISQIEDLPVSAEVLFVYAEGDSQQLQTTLHKKNQISSTCKVVLALGDKNYSCLKVGFRMGVVEILERPFKKSALVRAIGKSELLQYQISGGVSADLPVDRLLQLFSAPIKLKSDEAVYQYIKDYIEQFSELISFRLFYNDDGQFSPLFGNLETLDEEVIEIIHQFSTAENYIGQYRSYCDAKACYILFPLFEDEEKGVLWGKLVMSEDISMKVMNKYFLNFLQSVFHYRMAHKKADSFKALANKDEVTGLYNQRKLSIDLKNQIKLHEKNLKKFSIMFIDVDHFKIVNDNWGHISGSNMLTLMGNAIKKILRGSDFVYRYGGDEFVVITPSVAASDVQAIATRILNQISEIEFDVGEGKTHQLTVSIGIAEYPTDATSAKDIIKFADEMMYMSKRSGRGKVFYIKEIARVNARTK